jgi:hypothetical protein
MVGMVAEVEAISWPTPSRLAEGGVEQYWIVDPRGAINCGVSAGRE